jgi:AP2-associated kinase
VLRVVRAMHCRDAPIIHRDLKPENVVALGDVWKLCDFGSATTIVYDLREREAYILIATADIEHNTTPTSREPEMVDLYRGHAIGPKADIWALGCLLYKMCTLRDEFPEGTTSQILNGKYEWNQPWEVSDFFREIGARCLQPVPDNLRHHRAKGLRAQGLP